MKFKLSLFILLFSISIFAKEVNLDKAMEVAECFIHANAKSNLKSSSNFELTYFRFEPTLPFQSNLKASGNDTELIYIFDINQNDGFVIVSGDDRANPILGYSFKAGFSEKNIPENVAKWIEAYKNQIRDLQSKDYSGDDRPNDAWEKILEGSYYSNLKSTTAVDPLLKVTWSQEPYVNDLCPYV